ncbi:MAG TPA: aminotransferase class III-fold pyridoxal phosphate-dependent enzyme, partial [Pyrinomonadaceae bacterium]
MTKFSFEKSKALSRRAHELIPAGAHTYSKADDQFPLNAPGFIERGEGCTVWDVDGNKFLDWGMGLRSVILGHSYPAVNEAVFAQIAKGVNFLRP